MTKPFYATITAEALMEQHHDQDLSVNEMARRAGVGYNAMRRAFEHYGVPVRQVIIRKRPHLNAAWLVHQHYLLGRSTTEMALAAGVSQATISITMGRLNVPALDWRDRHARRDAQDSREAPCSPRCRGWAKCLDDVNEPCAYVVAGKGVE